MRYMPYGDPELSDEALHPTSFFDFDHPEVEQFTKDAVGGETDPVQQAIRLFYAVRDQVRYDMYGVSIDPDRFRASDVVARKAAFCIPKASLLVACLRGVGIPAVIGTSDVVNHFTTPKMEQAMQGRNVFMHHGYATMFLNGKWVKAVPAFNKELCEKMGAAPTEFDGQSNALLQEYDAERNLRMSYLKDHGHWTDLPITRISDDFQNYYQPGFFEVA
ncbi:transglutaminase-like domain-containing protein [Ruegeria sp.]|uniref:transglutaminase-like domain-containing protein n=1 Tax=Ruegeria sp. TaxID=1879320 RepID=UPI003B5CC9B0